MSVTLNTVALQLPFRLTISREGCVYSNDDKGFPFGNHEDVATWIIKFVNKHVLGIRVLYKQQFSLKKSNSFEAKISVQSVTIL